MVIRSTAALFISTVAVTGLLVAGPAHAQRSTPVTVTNPVAVEVQNDPANPVAVADTSVEPFYAGVFLNHGTGADDTCQTFSAPEGKVLTLKAVHVRVRGIASLDNSEFKPDINLVQIEAGRGPLPLRRAALRVTDIERIFPGVSPLDFGGTLLTDAPMAGDTSEGRTISFDVCFGRTFGQITGNFIAADITLYGEISNGEIFEITP
ncbi:MAG: hypothetical protein AAFY22_11845 [Pseudomonadota bacterium]